MQIYFMPAVARNFVVCHLLSLLNCGFLISIYDLLFPSAVCGLLQHLEQLWGDTVMQGGPTGPAR